MGFPLIGDADGLTMKRMQEKRLGKPEPKLIIGSKQANAYIGSVEDWSSCITAACGMGGGQIPMIVEEYETLQDDK